MKENRNFKVWYVDGLEKFTVSFVSTGVQQQLDATTAGEMKERGHYGLHTKHSWDENIYG